MARAANLILLGVVLWWLSTKGKQTASKSAPRFMRWTRSDMKAFMDAVGPTGVKVPDALLVYTAESGLDPSATSHDKSGHPVAFGICQATLQTLRGLNWSLTGEDFAKYDVPHQAPWVGKLLRSQIEAIGYTPANALALYVANFSPAGARSRSEIIYRAPSAEYTANSALDRDRKGYIAKADLASTLERAGSHPAYKYALQVFADLEAGGKLPRGATEAW